MNLYSFLRGFSQCQRRIHSSTQMMSYNDFSKSRFFDFFLDWSPGSKNVPQACRDLPGRFATLPDPENRPKTEKNAILFENYFFNCWRRFLFLTAFKHYWVPLPGRGPGSSVTLFWHSAPSLERSRAPFLWSGQAQAGSKTPKESQGRPKSRPRGFPDQTRWSRGPWLGRFFGKKPSCPMEKPPIYFSKIYL